MIGEKPTSNQLAENRTDFAEDRTLMAVERTMASWIGTGFGAIGVGLGLRALFARIEPSWVPRLLSTIFLLLAIFVVISAEQRMCRALERYSSHQVVPPSRRGLKLAAYAVAAAAAILIPAIWLFYE